MIKEGCLNGVDEVYGCHNIPGFTAGQFRVVEGAIFAASTIVRITVKGHGGHGSAPHKTRDPINAAAFILTGMYSQQGELCFYNDKYSIWKHLQCNAR